MTIPARAPGNALAGETVYVESEEGFDEVTLAEQPDPECKHESGMGFDFATYFIGAVCRKCGGRFLWEGKSDE